MGSILPRWMCKAIIQNLVAILPRADGVNHLLQMANGAFSEDKMLRSYSAQIEHLKNLNDRFPLSGKSIFEIGPGCYGIAAVLFSLFGCEPIYAIDTAPKLRHKLVNRYLRVLSRNIDRVACDIGVEASAIADKLNAMMRFGSLAELLRAINAHYLAPGDARSTDIPSRSIDLIYSYGVLEHIPKNDLIDIFKETERIMKFDGRQYHNIGLHDHFHNAGLGNGVNFLKYSDITWSLLAGNTLAYHSRLRKSDYLQIIHDIPGFITYQDSELLEVNLLALKRLKVHAKFRGYSEEDLACSHLYVEFGINQPNSLN